MKPPLIVIFILAIPALGLSQDWQKRQSAGLTLSFPWVNSYRYYDYYFLQPHSVSGFVGLGGSAFYRHNKNKFSVNAGFTADLPVPMGPFDYGKEGVRTNILSNFWEGLYHRSLHKRVNVIAGVNYVSYRFTFTSYVDTLPSYKIVDNTIGVTLGGEYRFTENVSLALIYRPAIISLDTKQYRHVISLDGRFDINFWRQRKKR